MGELVWVLFNKIDIGTFHSVAVDPIFVSLFRSHRMILTVGAVVIVVDDVDVVVVIAVGIIVSMLTVS